MNDANIQAELYHQCKLAGIHCELEVSFRKHRIRVDAMVVANNVKYAVEVKGGRKKAAFLNATKQGAKYLRLCRDTNFEFKMIRSKMDVFRFIEQLRLEKSIIEGNRKYIASFD